MNRKEYQARISDILEQAHEVTALIHNLMTDIGGDAKTQEWSWLYEVSRNAGSVAGSLYNELYPRPSALTDGDWIAPEDAYDVTCAGGC